MNEKTKSDKANHWFTFIADIRNTDIGFHTDSGKANQSPFWLNTASHAHRAIGMTSEL